MNPIITPDYVSTIFGFSKNIDRNHLERAIKDAQTLDLPQWICDDYLTEVYAAPDEYAELLDENEWETPDGKKRFHVGLRYVLAHYTAARYIRSKAGIDTPWGFVEKRVEWSQEKTSDEKMHYANMLEKTATKHIQRIVDFLRSTDYKDYNGICRVACTDAGFSITTIKPDWA